jgi:hypothetical protein
VGTGSSDTQFDTPITNFSLDIKVIRKVVERGGTPSLAEIGVKIRNWAQKKYKGVEQGAKLNFGLKLRVTWVWS